MKLTVVVPAFNEEQSVAQVVNALLNLGLPCDREVIVVDDGSTDSTNERLLEIQHPQLRIVQHPENMGKGAAIHTGIELSTGSHILIFDADEEYDPTDIARLIEPILRGRAEVVFGSRMSQFGTVHPTLLHAVGNSAMTLVANVLYNAALSDMHTCLKLFPMPLVRTFNIDEYGFGLDTELVAEMLRAGFRPYEVPISYVGRAKEDGKKIRVQDAIRCFYVLVKCRFRKKTTYGNRDRSLAPKVVVRQA